MYSYGELYSFYERVMNKFGRVEKIRYPYEDGIYLTNSEAHTINAIGLNEKITTKEISEKLGLAEDTILNIVKNLTEEGFMESVESRKLTSKGIKAYNLHKEAHKKEDDAFFENANFPQELIGAAMGILQVAEKYYDQELAEN